MQLSPSRLLPQILLATLAVAWAGSPPSVNEKAPDFTLKSMSGKPVRLSDAVSQGPVVLLVLRGYPGYQCPYCTRQVREFRGKSQEFAAAGARVLMVYPGGPKDLDARATEFMGDAAFPEHFEMLLDPGYEFTNMYGLRWEAEKETAYPSTFVIDRQGTVAYAKVSRSHGGRASAAEVLEALAKITKN